MKDAEDEAFDELAKRQGMWGGGFQAKRTAAADKLQEPEREALKLAVDGLEKILHTFAKDGKVVMASMIRNELFAEVNSLLQQAKAALAQPAQEPVAWMQADREHISLLEDVYHTIPLYTAPPKREWVGLTDGEVTEGLCRTRYALQTATAWVDGVEWAAKQLKEKNNG